nr:zinc finger, CCHC-type [Tanacetum cinerariifolium]
MDEAIQGSCVIDKLSPSWKDFKHTLKHNKNELTLVELGIHLLIEESLKMQDSFKPKGNNDEAFDKFKVFKTEVLSKQRSLIKRFRTNKEMITWILCILSVGIIYEIVAPYSSQQNGVSERKNRILKEMVTSMLPYSGLSQRVWDCRAVLRLLDPKLKTLEERGIECIFVGYAEHSKTYLYAAGYVGELEKDAVNLLKRIRKFFMAQDIGARAAIHIFNRISFAIAKGVGAQLTMNGKTYRYVLCYRLGVPLFSASKPCSACSKVFTGDIYGDHAVSCAGIIGIKHRHNMVRDTLVDICFRPGISAGLDVCVDLTRCSPLTQTGLADFLAGRAVVDAAHRKCVKYDAKCADIGYGFLPFSFSSFGELENDAVNLLKRIRKFSVTQDIRARATVYIFNRISFAIAKGVRAQLVSRHPTNFL